MSYYIIPKIVNKLFVEPNISVPTTDEYIPYISRSLYTYVFQIRHQLMELFAFDEATLMETLKLINPYEYLFSNVPGSSLSVSKLSFKSNIFYDLLEIKYNLNLFDDFSSIHTLHVTNHFTETIACIEMLRENTQEDTHLSVSESSIGSIEFHKRFDFIFFQLDSHNVYTSFVHALITMCHLTAPHGTFIMHVEGIFDKVIVDGIFLLSSLFNKVYICKPSSNNVATFNKYIVCKEFHCTDSLYLQNIHSKLHPLCETEKQQIETLFHFSVPCYFRNKIDEINVIIGQQQLEALEGILSIYRNKNKQDKIETMKKANIQKSILWCEKYRIPCNRFSGKVNMFLPVTTEGHIASDDMH